jgi:alginate O-acetyltransferase complex protein AlgJ
MTDHSSGRLRWPFYRRRSKERSEVPYKDAVLNHEARGDYVWEHPQDFVECSAAPLVAAFPGEDDVAEDKELVNVEGLAEAANNSNGRVCNEISLGAESSQHGLSLSNHTSQSVILADLGATSPPTPALAAPLPRVFWSRQNRLYLVGGSNDAANLFTEEGFQRNIDANSWAKIFERRRAVIQSTGSKFIQLVVPEKLAVYPLDEIDLGQIFGIKTAQDIASPGTRLLGLIDGRSFVFPAQFLRDQRSNFPIYPLTDSHWTWQGAFSAFQAIMWEAGYRPDYNTFVNLPKVDLSYHGDLWDASMGELQPDKFVRVKLPLSIRRIYANSIVGTKEREGLDDEQGLHMGSHCIFNNDDSEIDETLILFGSSFSECRLEPSLLTAICCHYFRTVHFIWSTFVDFEYVSRHKPNLTIAEMPERFLTICPNDGQNQDDFARERLAKWLSTASA